MSTNAERHEFDASEVAELLAELDRRLRHRGDSASVFVVGGAAVAMAGIRGERLTEDVDVVTDEQVVLEEASPGSPARAARELAQSERPDVDAAAPWVTYADDEFLFATKLIAQRAKDTDDVAALAKRLGMQDASADELESHMRRYYTDHAALEFIVDGDDVDSELHYLAEDAARMLRQRASR